MSIFKCKMCKGDLRIIDEENGLCECESCGTTQTVPLKENKRKGELYNTANQYRKNNRFDQAAEVYKKMIHEFPDEAEAYWGMVLCRYGIEYVEDPKTRKMIPTCHRTIPCPIFEDSDYQLSCKKAKPLARKQYEKEAAEIDRLQKKIFMLVRKEEPFDIFISYKEQDDITGQRTEDSVIAQEIYEKLTREGYKVFFSRITLEGRIGEDYEPIIYAALYSSKVLLLVGTSREHMDAVWVRNEWTRFLDMMEADPDGKSLIPIYEKMNPYDIPEEISRRRIQALDASKIGYQQDLLHGIKKVLRRSQKNVSPFSEAQGHTSTNTGGMIERGFICLKDERFEEASEVFKQVLNIDPHSGGAYLGRLMVSRKVKSVEELKKESKPLSVEVDYEHVMEYGDAKLKKQLREYDSHILELNRGFAMEQLQGNIEACIDHMESKRQEITGWKEEVKKEQEKLSSKQQILKQSEHISYVQGKIMLVEAVIGIIIFGALLITRFSYYWSNGNGVFGKIGAILNFAIMGAIIIAIAVGVYCVISSISNAIINKKMGGQKEMIIREAALAIKASDELIDDRNTKIGKAENELAVLNKVHDRILEGKEEFAEQFSKMDGYAIEDAVNQMVKDLFMKV